jgi:AraC-like DNA-binding protein
MSDVLKAIGETSQASLESTSILGGSAWAATRKNGSTLHYQTELPSGLHLACGTGSLTTVAKGFGGFRSAAMALTAMLVPDPNITFETQLEGGDNRTLGFHIPLTALEGIDTSIEEAFSLFEQDNVFALTGADAKRAMRLLAPIDPWFQGSARDLILQARALELLAVVVASKKGYGSPVSDAAKDKKAMTARDYLETCLENPPKLETLAKLVGQNTRSLTEAFRLKYGESIGEYVTRRRMELALNYLEQGESVAETAYKIGYQPNAFTTAFTRRYGVPPSGRR